jgi:hypothetical protein
MRDHIRNFVPPSTTPTRPDYAASDITDSDNPFDNGWNQEPMRVETPSPPRDISPNLEPDPQEPLVDVVFPGAGSALPSSFEN